MLKTKLIQLIKPAVVALGPTPSQVKAGFPFEIFGSGFNIHPSGKVITCSHVVEAFIQTGKEKLTSQKPGIEFFSGQTLQLATYFFFIHKNEMLIVWKPVVKVQGNSVEDVALLELSPGAFLPEIQQDYPVIKLERSLVSEGDEILVSGFPLGRMLLEELRSATPTNHFGHIAAVLPFPTAVSVDRYQLDISANHGNSGSPVINNDGEVIGMLQGGFPEKGIAYATPSHKILKAMEDWDRNNPALFAQLEKQISR